LGDRLSTFNLAGIGHAQVVVEVFRRAGPNLTRRGFLDAIPTLRDFPTETMAAASPAPREKTAVYKTPVWLQTEPGGRSRSSTSPRSN
jgi:hypothetical protein